MGVLSENAIIGASGAGAVPVEISHTAFNNIDFGGLSQWDVLTATHSSQSVGTATSDRLIVAAFCISGGQANPSASGATVAGNAMTKIKETVGGDATITTFFSYNLTSGTTATFTVTYQYYIYANSCSVWAVYNADHTMADSCGSTADPGTCTIDIPASGAAMAASSTSGYAIPTHTWTGLTEDSDNILRGWMSSSSASDAFEDEQTNRTVTVTRSTDGHASESVVSFGPA